MESPRCFGYGAANPCRSLLSEVLHEYVALHSCHGYLLLMPNLAVKGCLWMVFFNDCDCLLYDFSGQGGAPHSPHIYCIHGAPEMPCLPKKNQINKNVGLILVLYQGAGD